MLRFSVGLNIIESRTGDFVIAGSMDKYQTLSRQFLVGAVTSLRSVCRVVLVLVCRVFHFLFCRWLEWRVF